MTTTTITLPDLHSRQIAERIRLRGRQALRG